MIKSLIAAQGFFNFLVIGQIAAVWRADLARGLAFCTSIIEAAIFGQNARRRMSDAAAHVLVFHIGVPTVTGALAGAGLGGVAGTGLTGGGGTTFGVVTGATDGAVAGAAMGALTGGVAPACGVIGAGLPVAAGEVPAAAGAGLGVGSGVGTANEGKKGCAGLLGGTGIAFPGSAAICSGLPACSASVFQPPVGASGGGNS